jgi:hypothetical protein
MTETKANKLWGGRFTGEADSRIRPVQSVFLFRSPAIRKLIFAAASRTAERWSLPASLQMSKPTRSGQLLNRFLPKENQIRNILKSLRPKDVHSFVEARLWR